VGFNDWSFSCFLTTGCVFLHQSNSLLRKSVAENQIIKSIVTANQSKLEAIERETVRKTGLPFVTVPDSIVVLGVNRFV
jgi:hypothetical protein